MWIYKMKSENEKDVWEVGYMEMVYGQDGVPYHQFISVEPYDTKAEARKAVNYLNGGSPEVEVTGVVYNTI